MSSSELPVPPEVLVVLLDRLADVPETVRGNGERAIVGVHRCDLMHLPLTAAMSRPPLACQEVIRSQASGR
jgi:hypothetical protein